MDDVSGHRHLAARQVARGVVGLAMVACLIVSCSTEETANRGAPADRTARGSPTSPAGTAGPTRHAAPQPTPGRLFVRLPTAPATRSPAALARQLDQTSMVLRHEDAPPTAVRRAAEFQQLAVHTLATASARFRRQATAQLRPEIARITRSDVRAAISLRKLNSPAPKLPQWRIVAPPPATTLRAHYRAAQRRTGVPWNYLAAIHLVETRMGRIRGTSTAGARGPMQFLPSTWDLYGEGGDIDDPRDAILAAARLLKDNGAPRDMTDALWSYNPSVLYVRAVSEHARTMKRSRSAYRGYWHWRVSYRHTSGMYLLPVGYPDTRPVRLRDI